MVSMWLWLTCIFSKKCLLGKFIDFFLVLLKDIRTRAETKILFFCFRCQSRELGKKESTRFPYVTPDVENFFSDLMRAMKNYWCVGILRVHGICSRKLANREVLETGDLTSNDEVEKDWIDVFS